LIKDNTALEKINRTSHYNYLWWTAQKLR